MLGARLLRTIADLHGTFEKLKKAGLKPQRLGWRPTKEEEPAEASQIRVVLGKPNITAFISESMVQISYVSNDDLPEAIWTLQKSLVTVSGETNGLALALNHTSLTQTEISDIRKALLVCDFKMILELEKKRVLEDLVLSLFSELETVSDAEVQAKIGPILKKAKKAFSDYYASALEYKEEASKLKMSA